jgi:hypothetical protein
METFVANDGAYVVLGFAALSIPAAAATVAYFWYQLRRDEMLAGLKRELADRGMTAEEIRAVIEAEPRGSADVARDPAGFKGAGPQVATGTRR